jgi:hypothetical protein
MAAAAYIAANASNGDEHMRHLRNLVLKGVDGAVMMMLESLIAFVDEVK